MTRYYQDLGWQLHDSPWLHCDILKNSLWVHLHCWDILLFHHCLEILWTHLDLPLADQPWVSADELDIEKLACLLVTYARKCGGHLIQHPDPPSEIKNVFPQLWQWLRNTDVSSQPFQDCLRWREWLFSQVTSFPGQQAVPLPRLLTPALAVLKDYLIFRSPHTSVDAASHHFLCPVGFLSFIPQLLIPRVLS